MDIKNWNRGTLLHEISNLSFALSLRKISIENNGLKKPKQKIYENSELNKKSDTELRKIYIKVKKQIEKLNTHSTEKPDHHALYNETIALLNKKDQTIVQLQQQLESNNNNQLHTRTENSYQNIIAILLEYISGKTPSVEKHPSFVNEAQLINTLAEKYKGYNGISVSNLSRKLPAVRKNFETQ